jgi:uncharacterized membrane protein
MADSPTSLRKRLLQWGLVLVFILGAALRFWQLGGKSLWGDELDTVRILMLTPRMEEMIHRLHEYDRRTYVNPPLFFVIVKLSLGESMSEVDLRLIPALAGILSILAFFGLARQFLSRGHALLATLLFAVSPFAIYYSQESRPYSLFLLESIMMVWLSLAWLRTGDRRAWFGFLAATLLTLYTSYVSLMLLGCLGAATVACFLARPARLRRRARESAWRLGGLGLAVLIAGAFYLPWLQPTREFLHRNSSPSENKFLLSRAWSLNAELLNWPHAAAALTWLMLAVLIALAFVVRARRRAEIAFLATMLGLPVLLLFVFQPYHYHERHVIFMMPMLIVAFYYAGIELARKTGTQRGLRAVGVLLLAGWLAVSGWHLAVQYRTEKENWRDAVPWLEARLQPGDALIPGIYFTQDALIVYRGEARADVALYPDYLDPRALPTILERHRRVWFITSFLTALPDWLKVRLGNQFELMQTFPGEQTIYIYLYEAPADTIP